MLLQLGAYLLAALITSESLAVDWSYNVITFKNADTYTEGPQMKLDSGERRFAVSKIACQISPTMSHAEFEIRNVYCLIGDTAVSSVTSCSKNTKDTNTTWLNVLPPTGRNFQIYLECSP